MKSTSASTRIAPQAATAENARQRAIAGTGWRAAEPQPMASRKVRRDEEELAGEDRDAPEADEGPRQARVVAEEVLAVAVMRSGQPADEREAKEHGKREDAVQGADRAKPIGSG